MYWKITLGNKTLPTKNIFFVIPLVLIAIAAGTCQVTSLAEEDPVLAVINQVPSWMSDEEASTLNSLVQLDDYPLYSMSYFAEYDHQVVESILEVDRSGESPVWACSLFAVFLDHEQMLFGRNFDWDFSPALLLYTDPPDGYASVSMVDIYYLGFGGDKAFGITDLPVEERIGLLDAPFVPFDGMNEKGLVVGMAAVPPGGMVYDSAKTTIDSVTVIREILDQAATVDEAIIVLESFNIDWGSGPPLHYLIAEKSGRSALVEFSRGEIKVIYNNDPWQVATNFLVSEVESSPEEQGWRYGLISAKIKGDAGQLSPGEAMGLLEDVAQGSTQWSIVYGISTGEIEVVMGGKFNQVHKLGVLLK